MQESLSSVDTEKGAGFDRLGRITDRGARQEKGYLRFIFYFKI